MVTAFQLLLCFTGSFHGSYLSEQPHDQANVKTRICSFRDLRERLVGSRGHYIVQSGIDNAPMLICGELEPVSDKVFASICESLGLDLQAIENSDSIRIVGRRNANQPDSKSLASSIESAQRLMRLFIGKAPTLAWNYAAQLQRQAAASSDMAERRELQDRSELITGLATTEGLIVSESLYYTPVATLISILSKPCTRANQLSLVESSYKHFQRLIAGKGISLSDTVSQADPEYALDDLNTLKSVEASMWEHQRPVFEYQPIIELIHDFSNDQMIVTPRVISPVSSTSLIPIAIPVPVSRQNVKSTIPEGISSVEFVPRPPLSAFPEDSINSVAPVSERLGRPLISWLDYDPKISLPEKCTLGDVLKSESWVPFVIQETGKYLTLRHGEHSSPPMTPNTSAVTEAFKLWAHGLPQAKDVERFFLGLSEDDHVALERCGLDHGALPYELGHVFRHSRLMSVAATSGMLTGREVEKDGSTMNERQRDLLSKFMRGENAWREHPFLLHPRCPYTVR